MSTTGSSTCSLGDGTFFALGNPLFDINAKVEPEFLTKYKLQANGAILADATHEQLFDDLKRDKATRYFAGGSAQNIMRTIVWFLQKPKVASYMGCVGDDITSERLIELAESAGLIISYQREPKQRTGICAVLTTQNSRSMIASLGASRHFSIEHLNKAENRVLLENSKIIVCEAFFFQSCMEAFYEVADYSHKKKKIFCITLSSKYIVENRTGSQLLGVCQFADYIFAYEEEAILFAKTHLDMEKDDIQSAIMELMDMPKLSKRPRTVVVSRILERTIVGTKTGLTEYPWKRPERIVDTHGCGEAFAGGFLAGVASDKNIDECAKAGIYCAYECLKQIGCTFPDEVSYDPSTFGKSSTK